MTPTAPTTTTVDRAARTITVERRFGADAERVWIGWTRPEALARWWGPDGWTTTVHELDLRPGGCWWYTLAPDDRSTDPVHGVAVYAAVAPVRRLDYHDAMADDAGRRSEPGTPIQVDFVPDTGGTRVILRATYPHTDELDHAVGLGMITGFEETLDRLAHFRIRTEGNHHDRSVHSAPDPDRHVRRRHHHRLRAARPRPRGDRGQRLHGSLAG